ncbi:MAG TPA: adenylate/guanylate cyclase domain-containing protein [Sulfurimonas sp.]|nr:adenylate/guanylate cyclase domain-containing protein [Sulfurimonas sp.]
MFSPKGVLLNIPIIQDQAYSSGFLNNVPDPSGMIRSVPLVMKYDDSVYPSFAFEVIRIAYSASKVMVKYDETGINTIKMGDVSIPTDRFGRLFINYKGPARTFEYISAVDIITKKFDPMQVAGKIVLVGTSAYGLMDLRSTPLDSILPGVEIHANIIDNILRNEMLHRPDWGEGADLLVLIFIVAVILLGISYVPLWWGTFVLMVLIYGIFYGYYTLLFEQYIILNIVFPILTFVLSIVVMLGIKYFFEIRQKEMIKGKFSQKVSPQVMEDLINEGQIDCLTIRDENVTIFFSDMRSFTTISEEIGSPQLLVEFLNYYMTQMAETIISREGTIDKFIGDAIMAYWNAPNSVVKHADYAVQAALEQVSKRDSLNEYTIEKYGFELDYGIGLNTGYVTIGDIGSEGRSDYTVIGDPVNLAARLEGLCKYYGVRLIISEFTMAELVEDYIYRELDCVKVKGKHEPVTIYEVMGKEDDDFRDNKALLAYQRALSLFRENNFVFALSIFEELNIKNQHNLYKLYIDRCNYLIENKITDFDGVFEFNFK